MSIIEIGALATVIGVAIAVPQVFIAFYAYRNATYNSYGLPPIAVMRGIDRPHDTFANGRQPVVIRFELWNRQTYPIVLHKSDVYAVGFEEDDYCPIMDKIPTSVRHNEVIAPGGHGCYERKGTMPVFSLAPACTVYFGYFDPITNRREEISSQREAETMDALMRESFCSAHYPSPIGNLRYQLRERLSVVYSSLQSACQHALVRVQSFLSRLRVRLQPTASPSGPTESARRGWFRLRSVSVPSAR
jgi:hypothetical protein